MNSSTTELVKQSASRILSKGKLKVKNDYIYMHGELSSEQLKMALFFKEIMSWLPSYCVLYPKLTLFKVNNFLF